MNNYLKEVLDNSRPKTDGFEAAKSQTIALCEKGIELIDNGQTSELRSLLSAIIDHADDIVVAVMENTDQANAIPEHLKA